jgi:signal peptidase I
MAPALEAGDRVIVLRKFLVPHLRKGQIVILTLPHKSERNTKNSKPLLYIKRIVALGGETFEDTHISAYRRTIDTELDQRQCTWHIPSGFLFVCGDNQNGSIDSRIWGPLPLKSVQGIVLLKLARKASQPTITTVRRGLALGQLAPAFSAPSLSGEMITLHHYRGQKLLLLFIAAHKLCRAHLPFYLSRLAHAMATGLTVVCVSADELEKTRAFREELHLTVPILVAPREQNAFLDDYQVSPTPAYCLLDEQGTVLAAGSPSEYDRSWQQLLRYEQAGQLQQDTSPR